MSYQITATNTPQVDKFLLLVIQKQDAQSQAQNQILTEIIFMASLLNMNYNDCAAVWHNASTELP